MPHLAARGSGVPGGALPTPPRVLTEEPLLRQVRDARPPPSSRGPDADAGVAEHARGAPPAQPQQLPQPGPGRVAVGRHEHRGLRGEQGPPVPARGPVALQAADLQGRGRGGGRQACRRPRERGGGRGACRRPQDRGGGRGACRRPWGKRGRASGLQATPGQRQGPSGLPVTPGCGLDTQLRLEWRPRGSWVHSEAPGCRSTKIDILRGNLQTKLQAKNL